MSCTTSTAPRKREFIGHDEDGSPIYGRRLTGEEAARRLRWVFAKDPPSKPRTPRVATRCSHGTPSVESDATASSADESAADGGDDGPPSPGARPRFAPALSGAVLGAGALA